MSVILFMFAHLSAWMPVQLRSDAQSPRVNFGYETDVLRPPPGTRAEERPSLCPTDELYGSLQFHLVR